VIGGGGGGKHEDEVSAGGVAEGADAVGVDVVLGGVGAEIADGTFHVADLRREDGGRDEAVVDGGGDVALGGDGADGGGEGGFIAVGPGAAVDEEDAGKGVWGAGGAGEVEEEVLVRGVAVGDVGLEGDGGGGGGWGGEEGEGGEKKNEE
jgi:hypothetical protein